MYQLLRGLSAHAHVDALVLAEPSTDTRAALDGLRTEMRGWGVGDGRIEAIEHDAGRGGAAWRALAAGRSLYSTLYRSSAFQRAVDRWLVGDAYDIVQCEYAYMAQYRRPATARGAHWVLDEHNVEFRLNATLAAPGASGRRGGQLRRLPYALYARRELAFRRTEELAACASADHVLTVSEADRTVLRAAVPGLAATVVPNGVDLEYFSFTPPTPDDAGVVFIGKMDYRPNVGAATWFCHDIWPAIRASLPNCTFSIVGARPTSAVWELARRPGVCVTGTVDDTRPYLQSAAVVVVPIRAGSGTRLKILEALATGRAVVTTTAGCEGIDAVDGRHLIVADDPAVFAEHVVRLLGAPEERARLGAAGRRLVEERYGWGHAVSAVRGVYANLVGEPVRAQAAS